ncbi:protein eva-1 isoform X1 [Spodoptera frugiperda]|uniref:Protein eva-1 isoform X1 n=1 Tax=Spodoptera frugiperda TaxID=7108 RepID=A0A9R0E962_SPOFR|nr:protein eva-1 isoform X1 [Spodoptera frugiperda]
MNEMCGVWYLVLGFLALPGPSCSNSDNLALLLDTLKIIQRAVCNDETVALACPRGTTISIQVAQYGKAGEERGCPALSTDLAEENKNCKRPNAMQYSLLQTVVEACQKKPQCKFSTLPMAGLVDPCPTQSKYVEVAYKCRPYEFRSRTGCEGEMIKLSCNPHSRIAIFDAQYGRTAFEAITCPQTQGVPDEILSAACVTPHAVKTVIQLCLGRRRCQIPANNKTFNSSCNYLSRPYLKVVYACVPLGVLSEKYESASEGDEQTTHFDHTKALFDETEEAGEKWGEPNADRALQPSIGDYNVPTTGLEEEITTTQKPKKTADNAEPPRSNSILVLSVSIGLLFIIIIIGAFITIRCYINRRTNLSKNGDMYTTEAPNVFNDAFSDIDNDADISHISGTFHDPMHPDMILYKNVPGTRGTLRAMKPLCTIYPSTAEANMYGNVDYVPSHATAPRFTRSRSNEEEVEPNVMTSPRSLGAHSTNYYYG